MSLYFWSDVHFNHVGILRHCSATRPYSTVTEMNEGIIARWNAVVKPEDTIHFLGDFGFKSRAGNQSLEEIFARLNGHKHLTVGNHDEENVAVKRLPWESIEKLRTIKSNGMRAEVCHYPLESWKKAHHGAIMLHGHCHGTLSHKMNRRFDVGADVEQNPRTLESFWAEAQATPFIPNDHHGEL